MSDITLLDLPLHIILNIMGNLNITDLRNVMLTCKTLQDVILNENSIWKEISRNRLLINSNSDNSQTNNLSWYNKIRVAQNWCKGIYRSKIVLYHQTNFMPWLKLHSFTDSLFLSVGSELYCYPIDRNGFPICKYMKWRLHVPVVRRCDVRTNDISRFVATCDLLICGNRDGCVAVYDLKNLKRKPRLLHHIRDCHQDGQMEVTAVEVLKSNHKQYVVTGSGTDSKLCFWCLDSDPNGPKFMVPDSVKCTNEVILGINKGIRCLHAHRIDDKLAIGVNGNSHPLVLEVSTGKLLVNDERTKNYKQAVRDVQWHNENTVMYVTHSGVLQLLDIRSGDVVFDVKDPFQSTLYCGKSDGNNAILVGSAEYSRCVLFDTRNSTRHVQMYFTQKKSSPIYCLDFNATKLIAAADRSLAVLNFNVFQQAAQHRDYSHAFEFTSKDVTLKNLVSRKLSLKV